ncbi:thioredoxin domain-containing protein [Candidatus Colwellia aromaticivorans]|uniref:thioredoxin domain-containing protein n=1 Tax=Candidatus Colwellia aromaticivorans TaxID=2267621 RepID=UPI001443C09C|nr:thioredoxin domain-containing protein [Candidatus Colwellia aromaticivorans]
MNSSPFVITRLFNLSFLLFCLNISSLAHFNTVHAYALSTEKLAEIRLKRQGQYPIKTQYLNNQREPLYTNELIREYSAYLLQHAHNPVDWYPWGKEAFAKAKKENKPIFLSIGYATCHWCHVMERESFDNEAIASYLNEHFISIKVDREQRPDLDEFYLTALQIFSGQGGWPITSFLTPLSKPFFVGTYFSSKALMSQLKLVQERWLQEQSSLESIADELQGYVEETLQNNYLPVTVKPSLINEVITRTLQYEDKSWGGIDQEPKFPLAQLLTLLMNQSTILINKKNNKLTNFISRSLNGMLQGGIYDQLAGGFHRYTADKAWRKPHFEKMLYDQAQLISLYTQGWLDFGNPDYQRISTETIAFLFKEMQANNGCFYSAIDADSINGNDDYYLWSPNEINHILDRQQQNLFNKVYAIAPRAFDQDAGPIYLKSSHTELAINHTELTKNINKIREKLLSKRKLRSLPFVDRSQITQWNAMTISALVVAGRAFNMPDIIASAEKCATSIWRKVNKNDGKLARIINQKSTASPALLVDYAQLIKATLILYDVSQKTHWLSRAQQLYDVMNRHYFDPNSGAFFNNLARSDIVVPYRSQYVDDTIMPAGNSSALEAMVMLQQRAGNPILNKRIKQLINYFANTLNERPQDMSAMLNAVVEFGHVSAKPINYAGLGNVRIEGRTIDNQTSKNTGKFEIRINIKEGWHVNSYKPLQEQLIATKLVAENGNANLKVNYPEGSMLSLDFSQNKLSLYTGKIAIKGQYLNKKPATFEILKLNLQVCNKKMCLLPEEILIKVNFNSIRSLKAS